MSGSGLFTTRGEFGLSTGGEGFGLRHPVITLNTAFEPHEGINPSDFIRGPFGDLIKVIDPQLIQRLFKFRPYPTDKLEVIGTASARFLQRFGAAFHSTRRNIRDPRTGRGRPLDGGRCLRCFSRRWFRDRGDRFCRRFCCWRRSRSRLGLCRLGCGGFVFVAALARSEFLLALQLGRGLDPRESGGFVFGRRRGARCRL